MRSSIQLFFISLILLSFQNVEAAQRLQNTVKGTLDKTCNVYLHTMPESKDLPIVVVLAGTGIYSTGDLDETNPVVQTIVAQKKAIVISIDKPGISFSQDTEGHYLLDEAAYNRYTQRDLIECVLNSIEWASSTPYATSQSDVFFMAHSEGTQVAVRTYWQSLSQNSELSRRMKGFFLSGLVMSSWTDIINSQVTDSVENKKFWDAYRNQDDKILKSYGDLAYAYWSDILATETNEASLEHLSQAGASAFFQIYQGLNDENTLSKPVMDFEVWNKERRNQKLPSLKFQARYYQADHGLNLAAMNDMRFALLAYLSP